MNVQTDLQFEIGDRVRDEACDAHGTFKGTWTSGSGAVMAVVLFDGEEHRERVDPRYLVKLGAVTA